ncbi:MAG: hypothetical protein SWK76_17425 [Actinomycetota bacterium]|nr:hypothetical protein [Actinomycetota bacterium]
MKIGCIFMGEGARQIYPSIGRPVSVEEALEHVDRAVEASLKPQIGRVDPDPFMLGVKMKDWERFLTLCFCCTCCCIAMRNMQSWNPDMQGRMHRLDGLSIEVTAGCDGCGKCARECSRKPSQSRMAGPVSAVIAKGAVSARVNAPKKL